MTHKEFSQRGGKAGRGPSKARSKAQLAKAIAARRKQAARDQARRVFKQSTGFALPAVIDPMDRP